MMQRSRFTFIIAATTVLLLAGCSNEESTADHANGELRLSTAVVSAVTLDGASPTTQRTTRANNTDVPDRQIGENQYVGVFVASMGADGARYNNYSYITDGAGGLSLLGEDDSQPSIHFPADGSALKISAYHPRYYNLPTNSGGIAQPYNFTVSDDQTALNDFAASDLLYAAPKIVQRTSAAVTLQFKHLLSKLTYTLKPGKGMTTAELEGATVAIVNAECAVKFNFADGSIASPSATIKSFILVGDTYGAVLPPQTFAAGNQMLRVTLSNGNKIIYTPAAAQTLTGGCAYNYEITVNRKELVAVATITDWESGNYISGNANMLIGSKTDLSTAAVGDYYMKDGSLESKDATLNSIQKKACIGIVFWTGKDNSDKGAYVNLEGKPMESVHGYVVALRDASDEGSLWLERYIDSNITSTDKTDWQGYDNSEKIKQFVKNNNEWPLSKFPAAEACFAFGTTYPQYAALPISSDWFFPSFAQLQYLYNNRNTLSPQFDKIKGTSGNDDRNWFASDYYWSSSSNTDVGSINGLNFTYGTEFHGGGKARVRAILAF